MLETNAASKNEDCIRRGDVINAFYCAVPDVMDFTAECYGYSCPNVEKIVGSVPALDAEPVKRGQWRIAGLFDDFYACPKCGEKYPIPATLKWTCCPVCRCIITTEPPKGEENAD